ncbi:cyclin-like protein [Lactarius pseudohatsudake]|nr:cyclin-like protein [Lactarius pseudohatsudake]
MATDFWANRATLKQARAEDLQYVHSPEPHRLAEHYFANRRESPVHIKNVVSESRLHVQPVYGVKNFPSDNSKLAEMDFYLVSDSSVTWSCSIRTARSSLCAGAESACVLDTEAGEVGVGIDSGPRYWGHRRGATRAREGPLQTAWYRSTLTLVLNDKTREAIQAQGAPVPPPRRSSRTTSGSAHRKSRLRSSRTLSASWRDLRVSLPTEDACLLYTLWGRYSDTPRPESELGGNTGGGKQWRDDLLLRMREARLSDLAHPARRQPVP